MHVGVKAVDGTRDRPPGKSAENWSRRDGIRAGAVTGPWRSSPRDSSETAARPIPGGPLRAGPAPVAQLPARPVAMGAWIGFGALLAAGLVVGAFLLRPEAPQPAPEAAQAPAEAPAAEAAPVPVAAPVAPPDTAAVPVAAETGPLRLRVGPGITPQRRAAIVAALEAVGYGDVLVEALPFNIATSRVGYYREADKAAAEALARAIAPAISEAGGEIGIRDYGQLLSDPEPGRLDLWVEG
jgi:hypothetical protein